jgi:hypothetical protein
MAFLATYTQQPNDKLDYDIPIDLNSGDTILSAVATTTPAGLIVNSVVVGSKVKLWVEGGTTGVIYVSEVLVTTTLGRKKEIEVKWKIKDY